MKALQALEGVAVEMSKEKEVGSRGVHTLPHKAQADNRDWRNYLAISKSIT
jgi:hypothetical protein